jgi:hydrogenase maturation protease HycI
MRGDDGVGPYLAEQLSRQTGLRVIDAGTVPENYLDEVVSFEPDLVIIFDAADFRGQPGEVRIVNEKTIPLAALSTHSIPLGVIYHLLQTDTEAAVIFVGVQPKRLDMLEGLSVEVKSGADEIIDFILKEFKHA